ncbi:44966_t:CDS:2, partial [Gigaspora margarita]
MNFKLLSTSVLVLAVIFFTAVASPRFPDKRVASLRFPDKRVASPQFEDLEEKSKSEPTLDTRWILSIDGGGIQGLIPARILNEIETKVSQILKEDIRVADIFDFVAGTST